MLRITLLAALLALAQGQLLLQKSFDTEAPIHGKTKTVFLKVVNIAEETAYHVAVTEGGQEFKLDKLVAKEQHSFNFTITLEAGVLESVAAIATYHDTAVATDASRSVYSNIPAPLVVYTQAEWDKRNTKHVKEWALFFLLAAIPVGLPASMWLQASKRLEALTKKK
eukprot:TRINITY_DN1172_c0_g1_i1.p1 TRINITY_DN1172_c0_g1~~TRINITY_DN1172_c0_g1_i1.p1  ORF type:complete len:167 (+),score=41.09 TRINITY_DN1172_c0_g1_i1:131-631(+)